ncbi:MAG TPA: mechanosensitive ion channel domain-containing protein [Stellaceae bacterium]|nr:mechanosensitive ion channel domain-containing protein [Stellaceae bacterium]
MMRLLFTLLLAVSLLLPQGGRARAQDSAAPPASQVSTADLQKLVSTLQDEGERQKLISELQGLIAAQHGVEAKDTIPSAETVLEGVSHQLDTMSAEVLAATAVVNDAPQLVMWFETQVNDRQARLFWLEVAVKLGLIYGCALIADWAVRLLTRRPSAMLAARTGERVGTRFLLLISGIVLEALPVIAFATVGYFILPFTHPHYATLNVTIAVINAVITTRIILAVARVLLLSPTAASLYSLTEETRNYLYIWVRRLTGWVVYGYAVWKAAWYLGLPGAIHGLLERGIVVMVAILGIVFVLQIRPGVAEWVRGPGAPAPEAGGGLRAGGGWRLMRHRLADTWHIVAMIYIIGVLGAYMLRVGGGFIYVARATIASVIILVAAGLITRFVQQSSRRGFAIGAELKNRFPSLETRANRYLPMLTMMGSGIVYFFAALGLFQAWGINSFSWLSTPFGQHLVGSLLTVAAVLIGAFLLWELFSTAIEHYLSVDGDGRHRMQSARARTLLPLARTTVLVTLMIMVTLIVLAELGVNIAPLLAGAGVVGLAIGFGSQALVKDVINGLFILIEDTLSVGDVVDLGSSHNGVVEALSIRTIRLRDQNGSLHTIPFSEVSVVRNMTRDYAYFVTDVGVAVREDPDRVIAALQEVGEGLRADRLWAPLILEPLDVVGIDRFTDTAMVLKVRLKTKPLKQWVVGREFNRRMKKAFDAKGIELH